MMERRRWKVVLTAGLLLSTTACEAPNAAELKPAVLIDPTPKTRTELNRVVSEALNGTPVRLAADALTHESVLIVDRVRPRDAEGLPLNGRELGKPEHFRLVKQASRCILIQERTGRRWILESARCALRTG
jgi:hypothetical protein